MKVNYSAWNVDIREFPRDLGIEEQLKFLIRFAVLAPSGHNSQPWGFKVGNNVISIHVNKERSLAQSDPLGRQLLISIGCSLENLLVAADYYGFRIEVRYFSESAKLNPVAIVHFHKLSTREKEEKHLIFSIPKRRTNRGKYGQRQISQEFVEQIKARVGQNLRIDVVTDKEKKDALVDIAIAAQIEAMESVVFREELSHYIKSNFTRSTTGMPGFTLGIPMPVSLIASFLIKRVNLSKMSKKKDDELLKKHTPAIGIITTANDGRENWIQAGQLFERIWLTAEREAVSCAPLAAPVQVGGYFKEVQGVLNTTYRPQVFFRLGYAGVTPPHSPRLSTEEILLY